MTAGMPHTAQASGPRDLFSFFDAKDSPSSRANMRGARRSDLASASRCWSFRRSAKPGFVCPETFDHTSLPQFIEARFRVEVGFLTPWRRSVSGELIKPFKFAQPRFHPVGEDGLSQHRGPFDLQVVDV